MHESRRVGVSYCLCWGGRRRGDLLDKNFGVIRNAFLCEIGNRYRSHVVWLLHVDDGVLVLEVWW